MQHGLNRYTVARLLLSSAVFLAMASGSSFQTIPTPFLKTIVTGCNTPQAAGLSIARFHGGKQRILATLIKQRSKL